MEVLLNCFRPLIDALFTRGLPFNYRWRLICLQPLNCLIYPIKWLPWTFSRACSVIWIPLRRSPGCSVRALVFKSRLTPPSSSSLRPLHIDIHGGGFVGGIPEMDSAFNQKLAERTGAVVISLSYRFAPRHVFPTAHHDVQDAAVYIVENAERLWGANPTLLTVSGFSVGGNLALGIAQGLSDTNTAVKGSVTFYNTVDFRLAPWEKPVPPNYPKSDPLFFLQPLFDSYIVPARLRNIDNPLMNPILADIRTLPQKMLFVIPAIDILFHEQTTLVERLKREAETLTTNTKKKNPGFSTEAYQIESMVFKGQLHGWLELPSSVIDESTRTTAFNAAFKLIRDIHLEHGWEYKPVISDP